MVVHGCCRRRYRIYGIKRPSGDLLQRNYCQGVVLHLRLVHVGTAVGKLWTWLEHQRVQRHLATFFQLELLTIMLLAEYVKYERPSMLNTNVASLCLPQYSMAWLSWVSLHHLPSFAVALTFFRVSIAACSLNSLCYFHRICCTSTFWRTTRNIHWFNFNQSNTLTKHYKNVPQAN